MSVCAGVRAQSGKRSFGMNHMRLIQRASRCSVEIFNGGQEHRHDNPSGRVAVAAAQGRHDLHQDGSYPSF